MPPTHTPKMSANATAAAASVALIPSQSSSSLFPSPFALPQTFFNHRRFLYRSFSCHATARRRLVINAVPAAVPAAEVEKKRVLIVNTNGGGHAVIGFYFARDLLGAGHEVTVLTVGEEGSDKMKKPPFTRFSELVSAGGRTVWGDPAEVGKIVGSAGFDVVLDNNGKDLDAVKWVQQLGAWWAVFLCHLILLAARTPSQTYPTPRHPPGLSVSLSVYHGGSPLMQVEAAKGSLYLSLNMKKGKGPVADWTKSAGIKQFLFISSAGIYKSSDEVPHVEGDPVKGDAGHVAVERYIADLSFSNWAIFRPQYMIGSGNNKDCEEWFFDRIIRERPVPIPGSGMQLTNISHVRDLSSMLCLAVANPIASSAKIFNCVSDRAVTFNGLVKLCAQAVGLEAKVVHYDPKSVGIDSKKAFPFRNMHFFAEPRAAKEILGWTSTTNLHEDLKERFDEYVGIGRDKRQIKFDIDDKILGSLKLPVAV